MNIETPAQGRSLISSPMLWALMLMSFGVSVTLAYLLDIRFDEAFTLNTTANGPVYAARQAIRFEQQAPLYFVLLSLWRSIDASIFFARLFSVLCFLPLVWVAAEASRRYLKNVNPLFAGAVIALHQQTVWGSLDVRLYALMTLIAGLLLLLFYDAYLIAHTRPHKRLFFIIVSVLALYTQYYLGFQLVAGAAALIVLQRWRILRSYLIDMAIVGVLFGPMLYVITGQVSAVDARTYDFFSPLLFLKGLYQQIVPLMISVEWIQVEFVKRWLVRIVVGCVVVLFARKIVNERKDEDLSLGMITLILTTFFGITYFFLGDEGVQRRHMSGLILPLVLVPLSALSIIKQRSIVFGWVILAVTFNVLSLYYVYRLMAKPGDFRRVAAYLTANEQPNQPILVFHADAALPLAYYYKGQNKLVAIPREDTFENWDPRNNIVSDEAQIMQLADAQPNAPERFWLVNDGWCGEGNVKFNCEAVEAAVDKYFDVESTKNFLEPTTVRLLRRRATPDAGK